MMMTTTMMMEDESIQDYASSIGVKAGMSWSQFLSSGSKAMVSRKAWKWLSLDRIPGDSLLCTHHAKG